MVVGLGGLASLEFDDLHQLLNEGRGQLWRGSRVNEVHQMPHMSGCGPHSEPGRGGIAAPTHVLDHSLGSQHLVQVVGVCPGHCFEDCRCPSGQLDADGTPIDASGQATEKSDLCPDHAGHVVQDLGRQIDRPSIRHGRIVPRPLIGYSFTCGGPDPATCWADGRAAKTPPV